LEADLLAGDGDNEADDVTAAAGVCTDEDAVWRYSSSARARHHSSMERLGRPISDSRIRCSIDRERQQIRHSIPC